MTHELVSLRVILLSESQQVGDLFRQAVTSSSLPIEILVAGNADAACRSLAEREDIDLVFLDAPLTDDDAARVISTARAAADPAFTMLLTAPGSGSEAFTTDAVATKPSRLEEATEFIQRSARVRLPSCALVVDDFSTMRSIVRKILAATRFPFKVTDAAEGFAALKMASESDFDIVFLDYNMPGISGLETFAEFKREKRPVSVVVMTSMQDDKLAERVRAQGAAYLKKPFYPADLEAVLCRYYGLRALNPKSA